MMICKNQEGRESPSTKNMKEVFNSCDLTDKEKLLLFYLLVPSLRPYLKQKGIFIEEAFLIVSVIGEERLEQICDDLNETIFDTTFIKKLSTRVNKNGKNC